jgi:hypothetical protein
LIRVRNVIIEHLSGFLCVPERVTGNTYRT